MYFGSSLSYFFILFLCPILWLHVLYVCCRYYSCGYLESSYLCGRAAAEQAIFLTPELVSWSPGFSVRSGLDHSRNQTILCITVFNPLRLIIWKKNLEDSLYQSKVWIIKLFWFLALKNFLMMHIYNGLTIIFTTLIYHNYVNWHPWQHDILHSVYSNGIYAQEFNKKSWVGKTQGKLWYYFTC